MYRTSNTRACTSGSSGLSPSMARGKQRHVHRDNDAGMRSLRYLAVRSRCVEIVWRERASSRNSHGSITPFLAASMIMMFGVVALAIDFTRNFETVRQIEFAAQSAALYGLSMATNSDGSYSINSAQSNILAAVEKTGTTAWNVAQSGPDAANVWSTPVTFDETDVQFLNNPNPQDPNEFFMQVRGRRDGNTALKRLFLPACYAADVFTGQGLPPNVVSTSSYRFVEVCGQPAARIGAGAPAGAQAGSRAAELLGFAALPLAVSNKQFAAIASPSEVATTYTVDLVSSKSPEYLGAAPAGHLKGSFVNVAATGTGASYYGGARGNASINQLEGLLNYFGAQTPQPTITPAMCERGSLLNAFDPADPAFSARRAQINSAMLKLPKSFYMVPVLAGDPSFAGANAVAGFARLKLNAVIISGGVVTSLVFNIGESVPVRNASSVSGYSGIPGQTSTLMPAPVFPFVPRQYDQPSNGITARPRGVVLAPSLSPRPLITS